MSQSATWYRFWEGSSWRSWRADRKEWRDYKAEDRRLTKQQSDAEAQARANREELREIDQSRDWAAAIGEQDVPIKTAKSEPGLAAVHGVRLLEERKQQGEKVWTPVDQGSVYFTDRKMVFSGSKDVQFRYGGIKFTNETELGFHVGVSVRKHTHILGGPVRELAATLQACIDYAAGTAPTARYDEAHAAATATMAAATELQGTVNQQRAQSIRPKRPISPAWIPGAVVVLVLGLLGGGTPRANDPIAANIAAVTPTEPSLPSPTADPSSAPIAAPGAATTTTIPSIESTTSTNASPTAPTTTAAATTSTTEATSTTAAVTTTVAPTTTAAATTSTTEATSTTAAVTTTVAPTTTSTTTTSTTTTSTTTTTTTTAAPTTTTIPPNPSDSKNCSDFSTHNRAQAWFDTYFPYYGDVARLDSDNDGVACESLP